jgi:UDP-N-acetylmuramate-alanine ligase
MAVREQYPNKKLVACLELHTYSSLNAGFLEEYGNTLAAADEALVFYTPEALEIKRLEALDTDQIESAFKRKDLSIFTRTDELEKHLHRLDFGNTVLLLMSSGNYGGLSLDSLKDLL